MVALDWVAVVQIVIQWTLAEETTLTPCLACEVRGIDALFCDTSLQGCVVSASWNKSNSAEYLGQ